MVVDEVLQDMRPGQVSGLLDGDGWMGMLRTTHYPRQLPRPRVEIGLRDDDPTVLIAHASVSHAIGRCIGRVGHQPQRRRWLWIVSDTSDIADLLGWIAPTPLLSPRGWRRAKMLREAVLLLRDATGRRRARSPHSIGEFARLTELFQALSRKGSWARHPLPRASVFRLADADTLGWYLSGLFAADGYVGLRNERSGYAPAAAITQRIDNLALLRGLARRVGGGAVYTHQPPGVIQSADWRLVGRRHCGPLARLLAQYPVPDCSPKASQITLWADIVLGRDDMLSQEDAYWRLRRLKVYSGPKAASLRPAVYRRNPLCACANHARRAQRTPIARTAQRADTARILGNGLAPRPAE